MLKRLLIPIFILALAVPLVAQRQALKPRLQPSFRGRPAAQLGRLQKQLDLTPAQVEQLKSLREANKPQRQAIMQDVRQKRQSLRSLMAQSNPDANQVGSAVLALKDSQKQAQQLRQQSLEKFKSVLTTDQLKKLEDLRLSHPRRSVR